MTTTGRSASQKYKPTPPVGSSQAEVDLRLAMQRQNMLDRLTESEEKVQARREYRQQALLDRERQIEESLRRTETERIARKEAREQEERLAAELQRLKADQLRDTKMRQQLKESR